MLAYIFKRLLLMVPTLFGVLLLTFARVAIGFPMWSHDSSPPSHDAVP